MKKTSLGSGFELSSKRTRKREFLEEMDVVAPDKFFKWSRGSFDLRSDSWGGCHWDWGVLACA
ncbi:hypothetical protein E8K88_15845 [Lampropedia aestuarii]|uniref:Uncharacterized protein n=1 Tax=Lampropedia aestuarii TaxID=2562762 RepID=A0A4S5BK45_9BURK|nr:hypothetical protein E8K88_15845 [Lampropedia aestuarii]